MTSFISNWSGINYENSVVEGLTPAEQEALQRYGSGASINAGMNIAQQGGSLVEEAIGSIEGLLHGGGKTQFMSGVKGLYNGADDFINQQDSAIQDSVYSEMGQTFGKTAQANMASTSVAGSSAAQSATNSVLASGANEMTQRMADVSDSVLKGAVGLTTNAMHSEVSLIDQLMSEGGDIFNTGMKITGKGASNQFKAGIFEQWYNQEVTNNNRKNDMINNNMDLLDMGALLELVLPTAGIDTTTTNTVKQASSGGMGGLAGIAAGAGAAMLMM
ncbi:hypothetical protein [Lelliottia wanjuensis]|uniref:hypothetical protein n=1 Tax=Lelliottia wanjuensis TaxID=3050585 RepID=UPI00254CD6F9|nr:hypothetical protein [Lelliottia sp. V86_10]